MRARYYSPNMKRFINADIIRGKITNAVTLNRYAYANANPVTNIDPLGLCGIAGKPNNRVFINDGGGGGGGGGTVVTPKPSTTTTTTSNSTHTPIAYDPPSSSEQAVNRDGAYDDGYIYSSDPYWEDLLTNNAAIYVAEYTLDVVAHAYVLLKDEDDSWLKTEFNTNGGNTIKQQKDSAIISVNPISAEDIIKDLSEPFVTETLEIPLTDWEYWQPTIPITYGVDGVQYVPIEGNFTKSVAKAYEYQGSDFGGYHFTNNNCLHYAKAILREGNAYNDFVEDFLTNSNQIVPTLYYDSLNAISQNKVLQKIDQMLMLRRLHEILG